jgi:thiopurine S-methyltransferase
MAHVAHFESVKEVVGVDGIRKALDEFSAEHPALEIRPMGSDGIYDRFSGKKVTLLKGDFFELDETTTGGRFDVIFDRASMVAIEPSLREQYVKTMSKLIAPGGKLLLVVIERRSGTEEDLTGPPFSIPETEVRRLYEGQQWVGSVTLLQDNGEQEQNKGSSMASLFFLIQASDVSIL